MFKWVEEKSVKSENSKIKKWVKKTKFGSCYLFVTHYPLMAVWEVGFDGSTYGSTSDKMGELGLPPRFTTKARIILIFNNDLKGFEAVINRGLCLDFNFNFKEKLSIFEEMKEKADLDKEVLEWIKLNCNESTENLSLRSLVILSNLKSP